MGAPSLPADVLENHPYSSYFLVPNSRFMIIGTFPNGKFANKDRTHEIKANEIDFFYGGSTNLHWPTLAKAFGVGLPNKEAIQTFLTEKKISVGDVIQSCRHKNNSAADSAIYEHTWNIPLREQIKSLPGVKLMFTSKTARKWFAKNIYPEFSGPFFDLPSPSQQANIAISGSVAFKEWKSKTGGSLMEYRVHLYRLGFELLQTKLT